MHKSKLFAIIIFIPIVFASIAVSAHTYFDPPTLVITKPAQPTPSLAPAGAPGIPFTRVDLTAQGADIIVEKIVVLRVGPAYDEVFEEIVLLDSNGEELGEGSLRSDHTVEFTEPLYIERNSNLHLTVAGNMAEELDDYAGQIAGLTIIEIVASGRVEVR